MPYIINNVIEDIYRGGRPDFFDLEFLKNLGFKNILSLENMPSFMEWETQSCSKLELELTQIPLNGFRAPDPVQLALCVSYMNILRKPLLVHCRHGRDRTGFVVAAYRILKQGWSFEKAYEECKDNGHKYIFYFWWKKSLKKLDSRFRGNDEYAGGAND